METDGRSDAPGGRLRYLDLLRVVSIGAVVVGHWLLVDVTYAHGTVSGVDTLSHVHWTRWATLVFQVMPVFFLVGGYVSSLSWDARHADGETWTDWVRLRSMRLLWPTTVYVVVGVLVVATVLVVVRPGPTGSTELARGGWLVALQLWFLSVYLVLVALTPLLLAAYRRWRVRLLAAMAVGAGLVDVGVVGHHVHVIGYANYLLVWGSMFVWGMAWRDGTLTRTRATPWAVLLGGAAVLSVLVARGPFPVNMVGAGERVGNTTPPSVALLAFAAVQTGVVLLLEPAASRLLRRDRPWRAVRTVNPAVMTVYLWHMVPVVLVGLAVYPTGLMPQPALGTWAWWGLRVPWVLLLSVVLAALTVVVLRLERPMVRLPVGLTRAGPWSPVLLGLGTVVACAALARLAIGGFAPDGRLPTVTLAGYALGLLLTLCSGRPRTRRRADEPVPGPAYTPAG